MITVHHLNNSRSQRILFALEELAVPYEIVHHARDKQTMLAPPELLAVHPLGKSPVIVDGDRTIAESGAILEYLVERYGNGTLVPPRGTPEHDRYTYWMHYAEGSLMPVLLVKLIADRLEKGPVPFFVRPIVKMVAKKMRDALVTASLPRHLAAIELELGKSTWLAGDAFTAADIQMSFPLEAAMSRGGLDDKYPKASALVAKLKARPAYQRAAERGGPNVPF